MTRYYGTFEIEESLPHNQYKLAANRFMRADGPQGFQVMRWQIKGPNGVLTKWFHDPRDIEEMRMKLMVEFYEQNEVDEGEPELLFLEVPRRKRELMKFLTKYCS